MKVFLTGGTGFVGGYVLEKLLDEGHDVKLLVRPSSKRKLTEREKEECEIVTGDVLDKITVKNGMEGADVVINLVGIIRESPQKGITFERLHSEATFNCVLAAQENDVERFLQMSALGAGEDADSDYHESKHQAEVLVKNSEIDYTIFRPSVIFGEGDESVSMISDAVREHRFFPLIGGGRYRWQPVHVRDVAEAIVKSLDDSKAKNSVVEMGGSEIYEFRELVDKIAELQGTSVIKVPIPVWLVRIPTAFFQYQKWYPLSLDMLKMLQEDNVVEGENFDEIFDLDLTEVENYLKKES